MKTPMSRRVSRRKFVTHALEAAAGSLLLGCAPAASPQADQGSSAEQAATLPPKTATATELPASAAPEATATSQPRPTATPTLTPTTLPERAYRRPEIVRFYPDVNSTVVRVHDPKVWNGDALDTQAVRSLIDTAIVKLTGLGAAQEAWKSLFEPGEKIAIKVNAFRNSTIWTHVEVVQAVTDSLVEAGMTPEDITVFDYLTDELETAGFKINKDGPGVRCYGTDQAYGTRWPVAGRLNGMSDILVGCDALINMPVLKSHMIAGITFALKNHYGSVVNPDALHTMAVSLPALNALSPIQKTTRLVVGDILHANTRYTGAWPYWVPDTRGDSILMSFDPLAHDYIGREILAGMAKEKGENPDSYYGQSDDWFAACEAAGLGTANPEKIELVEM